MGSKVLNFVVNTACASLPELPSKASYTNKTIYFREVENGKRLLMRTPHSETNKATLEVERRGYNASLAAFYNLQGRNFLWNLSCPC